MTASAYHLFKDLCEHRAYFAPSSSKEVVAYSPKDELIAEKLRDSESGQFPDMYLRTNVNDSNFSGGELIEIKDSLNSYRITPFNSTIPSGRKSIKDVLKTSHPIYKDIFEKEGRDPYALETREVYYLVRGKKTTKSVETTKVCLVHGCFFETVPSERIIKDGVSQTLNEAIEASNQSNNEEVKKAAKTIIDLAWEQEYLSRTRHTENASVSLRFRVLAQVRGHANLLSANQYPEIKDNTLNMVVPIDEKLNRQEQERLMGLAWGERSVDADLKIFPMAHKIKGQFLVFQASL